MPTDPRTRRAVLAGAAALGAAGAALLWRARERDPEQRARELGAAQGVRVAFGDPSSFFTPPYTPADAKIPFVETTAAERGAYTPALDGIEAAFAVYPPGFMSRLISAIFICGRLTIEGTPAGGTYGPAWLLLSAPLEIGASSITLTCRMGVHHELSSFVYMRGDVARRWEETEPADWRFAGSSGHQLANERAGAPAPETGFLSAYGATSPENDFNVYAESLLTDMEAVMELARRHPIVARKAELVREAYADVDARMEDVLRRLGMRGAMRTRASAR